MKRTLSIVFIITLLSGCKEKYSSLHIVLSKTEKKDSTTISLNRLYLKNSDSTFYKLERPNRFNFQDTIKIEKVPIGTYTLEYIDILGNEILKTINISENPRELHILSDSINTEKFKNQIPFINLKNNNFYTVEMKGGCVASFHGNYKVIRIKNTYYFESIGIKKRILDQSDIVAIKKFESELLAIDGKDICSSTGRKTFKINSDISKEIVDNTCDWNGWSNLFSALNK